MNETLREIFSKVYLDEIILKIIEIISLFGLKFILAIALLIVSKFAIRFVRNLIRKVFESRHVDAAITSFICSLTNGALWIFVIIIALSQLGIQTTSFIAVLGAAGLAIGLALQGSLSNFAAGFLIILFRPFKVGDLVDVGGILGIINCINMFTTEMVSPDNRRIIIPNSQVMNGVIINITSEKTRRVDFSFSVAHNADIVQVKNIIHEIVDKHELIHKEPNPYIIVSALTNNSIDLTVRVWCNTENYWTVNFEVIEQVKIAFNNNNIGMPFPQYIVRSEE
jgi:small conductance mechanosensitive channel